MSNAKYLLVGSLVLWFFGSLVTTAPQAQTVDPVKSQVMAELSRASTNDFVPNEILIKFKPYIVESAFYDEADELLTTTGVPYQNKQKLFAKTFAEASELYNIYKIEALAGTDIKRAVTKLNNRMDVAYAEPNYKAYAFFTPNDPSFSQQYGLQRIQAPQAWDIHQGDSTTVAAVVDTGINSSHADLSNKVVNGSYDCGIYHGTHCAGIIAADTNNGVGIAGVGFKVNLAGYNALDCSGSGSLGTIAQEINNATSGGAKVINLSLGGPSGSSTLKNAIDNAVNSGVVVVASAGNCGEGCPSSNCQSVNQVNYPAAYDNVIAVAATDSSDQRACFSNKNDYVDVTAPGVSIYSTLGSSYGNMSGTSMSGPHVAGLAALLYSLPQYSARNTANAQAIRQIIETTTDD
ncbi:MAG: S8 family serine peptidase, partial [Candidatus Cloacimonetes bacterium]|nr:S8 family serine peptidase [Candidatus Cloacimonadota bacterium]